MSGHTRKRGIVVALAVERDVMVAGDEELAGLWKHLV
jgi:hypothetical protein